MNKLTIGLLSGLLAVVGISSVGMAVAENLDWGVTVSSGMPPPPVVYSPGPPVYRAQPVWVADSWYWNGAAYVLIPGHWEQPAAGYGYAQPGWRVAMGGGRYRERDGDHHHGSHEHGRHGRPW